MASNVFDGPAPVVSEFEARRVQRMLDKLLIGKLGRGESIAVSGWREHDWLCIRWELADADRTFVYPVDCRVDTRRQKVRDADGKALIYDFLGHFFGLFLDERDQPFTGPKWESVDFGGTELWIRGQVRDERADTEADGMLTAAARNDGPES